MRIRIQIKTPKGHAKKTAHNIKPFILGIKKLNEELKTNTDDSVIVWTLECDITRAMKIQRNITLYDQMVTGVFNSGIVKKTIKKYFRPDQMEEVKDMLHNQTKIKILKEDDPEW